MQNEDEGGGGVPRRAGRKRRREKEKRTSNKTMEMNQKLESMNLTRHRSTCRYEIPHDKEACYERSQHPFHTFKLAELSLRHPSGANWHWINNHSQAIPTVLCLSAHILTNSRYLHKPGETAIRRIQGVRRFYAMAAHEASGQVVFNPERL